MPENNLLEQIETDTIDAPYYEIYMSDGELGEDSDSEGLVWKDILREGEWAYRPGAGKAVPVPLKVVPGPASESGKEISMEELIASFNDQAVDHVTVPTSHDDRPQDNTGFVRKLRIQERDGVNYLQAGIEFTEKDIQGKAQRGSIANTSVGIMFDYVKKQTGKIYNQVLGHVALTNKPWINGMKPFGVAASEHFSEEDIASVVLTSESEEKEVKNLVTALGDVKTHLPEGWEVTLSNGTSAASGDEKDTHKGAETNMSEEIKDEGLNSGADDPAKNEDTESVDAQALLEDARKDFEAKFTEQTSEIEKLRKQLHEKEVSERIEGLKKVGLADYSGLLAEIRSIMLADSGREVLTLSEEVSTGETVDRKLTASDIVNRIIDALPKDESGKYLSDQALLSEDHGAPASKVDEESVEERAAAMAAAVGRTLPSKDGDK